MKCNKNVLNIHTFEAKKNLFDTQLKIDTKQQYINIEEGLGGGKFKRLRNKGHLKCIFLLSKDPRLKLWTQVKMFIYNHIEFIFQTQYFYNH